MRKALAMMLIGGSLAVGVSAALANEKDSSLDIARPATAVIVPSTASNVGTVESASNVWATPAHDSR